MDVITGLVCTFYTSTFMAAYEGKNKIIKYHGFIFVVVSVTWMIINAAMR
jgi:hypothetical protein